MKSRAERLCRSAPLLVVVVTGEHGAGKDFSAGGFKDVIEREGYSVKVVRISDAMKLKYAEEKEADFERLVHDRNYKEQHRAGLNQYYSACKALVSDYNKRSFLTSVNENDAADILIITGVQEDPHLYDRALVAPIITINVVDLTKAKFVDDHQKPLRFDLQLEHQHDGLDFIKLWTKEHLLPRINELDHHFKQCELLRLKLRTIPNHPKSDMTFYDVIELSEQSGALGICAQLMKSALGLVKTDEVDAGCWRSCFCYRPLVVATKTNDHVKKRRKTPTTNLFVSSLHWKQHFTFIRY